MFASKSLLIFLFLSDLIKDEMDTTLSMEVLHLLYISFVIDFSSSTNKQDQHHPYCEWRSALFFCSVVAGIVVVIHYPKTPNSNRKQWNRCSQDVGLRTSLSLGGFGAASLRGIVSKCFVSLPCYSIEMSTLILISEENFVNVARSNVF